TDMDDRAQTRMGLRFEYAAASVIGHEHARAGRNNQDAFCVDVSEAGWIAVVADGCSSGGASEVGARIGARLLVKAIRGELERDAGRPAELLLESARAAVLAELRGLADALGGNARTVAEHLLFTLVGALIGAEPT